MDRFGFHQFLGFEAGDDVPDAPTIWDFKQLLEKHGHVRAGIEGLRPGQSLRAAPSLCSGSKASGHPYGLDHCVSIR